MLSYLPFPLGGILGILVLTFHTLLAGGSIMLLTPLKLILRPFRLDTKIIPLMRSPFHLWYYSMPWVFKLVSRAKLKIDLPDLKLDPEKSSLIICNHQSWLDICVVLAALRNQIPSATFFLKKELLWVPFIGSSAWAMDNIFVNRFTKEQLKKNPELKGKDILNAKIKTRKLKNYPTAVINFVEGTRLTRKKYEKSPKQLKHLLPAKAGGVNFVLNAMSDKFQQILNVSIIYKPNQDSNLVWDFASGKLEEIYVKVELLPLTKDLLGNYETDPEYRKHFQNYLNNLWKQKDQEISVHFNNH